MTLVTRPTIFTHQSRRSSLKAHRAIKNQDPLVVYLSKDLLRILSKLINTYTHLSAHTHTYQHTHTEIKVKREWTNSKYADQVDKTKEG